MGGSVKSSLVKGIMIAAAIMLFAVFPASALKITEIMADPFGIDFGREWIEIYNDDEVLNIAGMVVWRNGTPHATSIISGDDFILHGQYAIISADPELMIQEYSALGINHSYLDSAVIIESPILLPNSGDDISITADSRNDSVRYGPAITGRSFELAGNVWVIGTENGTPGYGYQAERSVCDFSISVYADKDVYDFGDKVTIRHFINDSLKAESGMNYGFIIEYWIEDIYGNTIRNRFNSSNTNPKSWTANHDGAFLLKARVIGGCEDINPRNDNSDRLIAVRKASVLEDNTCNDCEECVGDDGCSGCDDCNDCNDCSGCEEEGCSVGTACMSSIIIETDKDVYLSGEKIIFNHVPVNSAGDIRYWIEDVFGHIVSSERVTGNTNPKSYTPKIKQREMILVLKAEIESDCNGSDVVAEKNVIVKNPDYENAECIIPENSDSSSSSTSSSDASDSSSSGSDSGGLSAAQATSQKKIELEILSYPEDVFAGEAMEIIARIKNNDNKEYVFSVNGYGYRSSKCITDGGDRAFNLVEGIRVSPSQYVEIVLNNSVSIEAEGDYLYKVIFQRQDRVTADEVRFNFSVAGAVRGDDGSIIGSANGLMQFSDGLSSHDFDAFGENDILSAYGAGYYETDNIMMHGMSGQNAGSGLRMLSGSGTGGIDGVDSESGQLISNGTGKDTSEVIYESRNFLSRRLAGNLLVIILGIAACVIGFVRFK